MNLLLTAVLQLYMQTIFQFNKLIVFAPTNNHVICILNNGNGFVKKRHRRDIFIKIVILLNSPIVLFILFIIHQQIALQSYLTSIQALVFA